jgi:hypothetical protein
MFKKRMEKVVTGHPDNEKLLKDQIFAAEYKSSVEELRQTTRDESAQALLRMVTNGLIQDNR